MSLLVVGTDGPVARALRDAEPPADPGGVLAAIGDTRPSELVIVALPAPAGPVGAMPTDALADLVGRMLTPAFTAAAALADGGEPVRIAIVCPAGGVLPDHADGARSVAAAGLAMLTEICAATPGLTANAIAVADDVPAAETAEAVRFALAQPSLNGATIRLDGGRDAALAAETRAEGD